MCFEELKITYLLLLLLQITNFSMMRKCVTIHECGIEMKKMTAILFLNQKLDFLKE